MNNDEPSRNEQKGRLVQESSEGQGSAQELEEGTGRAGEEAQGGKVSDGGPAFSMPSDGETHGPQQGMTLRDYFAAAAATGIIAAHSGEHCRLPTAMNTACLSYEYADEMLKARGVK